MAVRPVIIPGPRALKIGVAGSRPASLPKLGVRVTDTIAGTDARVRRVTHQITDSIAGTDAQNRATFGADAWPSGTPWPTGELWPT
jgi:hypothetical protein